MRTGVESGHLLSSEVEGTSFPAILTFLLCPLNISFTFSSNITDYFKIKLFNYYYPHIIFHNHDERLRQVGHEFEASLGYIHIKDPVLI